MGSKGSSVDYTPQAPSAQEKELLDLLVHEARRRDAFAPEREKQIQQLLGVDFSKDLLSPQQTEELNRITGIYQGTRQTAVDKAVEEGDKALRARFAAQGISDSSIAGGSYGELQAERAKALDQIAKEASMFRFGTEKDIRQAALQERLQKIGVLQGASSPDVAQAGVQALAGQREAESNRALQIALANAQNSGGWGSFLGSTLLGGGGALLGGLLGGPAGAAVGAGIGLSGASSFR